jgi:hypothetical protein
MGNKNRVINDRHDINTKLKNGISLRFINQQFSSSRLSMLAGITHCCPHDANNVCQILHTKLYTTNILYYTSLIQEWTGRSKWIRINYMMWMYTITYISTFQWRLIECWLYHKLHSSIKAKYLLSLENYEYFTLRNIVSNTEFLLRNIDNFDKKKLIFIPNIQNNTRIRVGLSN